MSKNKVISCRQVILFFLFSLIFTGCKSDSDPGETINKSEFLYQAQAQEDNVDGLYATVFRGDFIRTVSIKGNLYYSNNTPVTYKGKKIVTVFRGYLVEEGKKVTAGDDLISISYVADPIELEQLKIDLKYLHSDYKKQKTRLETDLEKAMQEKDAATSLLEKEKARMKCEAAKEAYESYIALADMEIQEKEDLIAEYELNGTTDTITAPCDGVVGRLSRIAQGDTVSDDYYFFKLYDEESLKVVVGDENTQLPYGIAVEVSLTKDNNVTTLEGTVISGDSLVTDTMKQRSALIEVPGLLELDYKGAKITVNAVTECMKDVLLVDVNCVEEQSMGPYVFGLVNGNYTRCFFTSGGNNGNYYWVMDKLTQGMIVKKQP